MEFCEKCEKFLSTKNGCEKVLCTACQKGILPTMNIVAKEKVSHKKDVGEGVVKDENIFATFHNKCEKCGYDKAEVIDMGIFYSDEDNLMLIKCGKCGYTERIGKAT